MRTKLSALLAAAVFAVVSLSIPSQADAAVYNPLCTVASLRTALNNAAAISGPHTINLPAGCTYTFLNTDPGGDPDDALPVVTRDITINGNGSTLVMGIGAPSMRFFEVRGLDTLTLNDMTLRGGSFPLPDTRVLDAVYAAASNGGAVRCTNAEVVFNGVDFDGNEANNGGAVFAEDCDVTVTDSSFTNNYANGGDGGALAVTAYDDPDVVLTLDDSELTYNVATYNGGAVLANLHHFTIDYSTLNRNDAGGDGGGLHVTTLAQEAGDIIHSTFQFNDAEGDGGGIYMDTESDGSMKVEQSTIARNTATNGGGLSMSYGGIHRSTISGNTATTGSGGGLYLPGSTVAFTRVTLADNVANSGVGNVIGGDSSAMFWPTANNLIAYYAGNVPGGSLCDTTGGLALYTLVPSLNNLSEGACDGFTAIPAGDAHIGQLAFNGGPTRTHAIVWTSAALDAGDQQSCDDQAFFWGDYDQRGPGYAMTYGAACDVGSYEFQFIISPGGINPSLEPTIPN